MPQKPVPDEPARPGPYRTLDTRRRARAAIVYGVVAAIAAGIVVATGLSAMWFTTVIPIVALAGYQLAGAWRMQVDDMEAIAIAGEAASFDFGHGSATLGYRGPMAKPVWQVLVFSDTPSPDHQALVTIDALSGEVTGIYEEALPVP